MLAEIKVGMSYKVDNKDIPHFPGELLRLLVMFESVPTGLSLDLPPSLRLSTEGSTLNADSY